MSLSPSGLKVWSDLVYKTAIAKTKGTYDAVNSNQSEVTIDKRDARSLLGFIIGYCATVITDAENVPDLFVEVTNKALGIAGEIVCVPLGRSDGDANNDYTEMETVFVPFKIPDGMQDKFFGSRFSFKASPSITSTGGLDVVIAVVYANGEPDIYFAMELLAEKIGRVSRGDAQGDAAKAHGTGGSAVSLTALTIESGGKMLRGLLGKINPNGITAGDPISGFIEFTAPGIQDFSPQMWPLSVFLNAALGTVADEPPHGGKGRYWPTRFPLTGQKVTVSCATTLLVAAGTAPDTTQALVYD